jgi:two-component system copper resistance phosphate regulon response regulator CusR
MTPVRALIIEDEAKVADAVREGLEQHGYEAITVRTGEDGFFLLETERFDVVILDLQLPGRDGLEILKAIRSRGESIPVVVVTARDTVADRVEGLDGGADDYLVKPFAFAELLARVRAVLRRGGPQDLVRLTLSDLEMDLIGRSVSRAGERIVLTAREFELLEYLLRHKGFNVTREMLARDVWNEPMRATSLDNVIDVHIGKLRKKVDEGFSPKLIHTVRGLGFVMKHVPN